MDRDFSNQYLALDSAELPDLLEWECRPSTQMVPEKAVIASPYVGGSKGKPRDIRTLRRWRTDPAIRRTSGLCRNSSVVAR
jgi:hypothetical protein